MRYISVREGTRKNAIAVRFGEKDAPPAGVFSADKPYIRVRVVIW